MRGVPGAWTAAALLAAALLLAGGGCEAPLAPGRATVSADTPSADTPSAGRETAGHAGERSIAPPPAPDPVAYRVSGVGPAGASFAQAVAAMPVDVSALVAGEWTIRVEGLDDAGAVVMEGATVARVSSDHAAAIRVPLAPPAGAGEVSLALRWPSQLVAAPGVLATLRRDDGSTVTLSEEVIAGAGTATVVGSSVPSGWYRLQLRLFDAGALIAGRADLLLVRRGATTTAALEIAHLNKPGAAISITGPRFTLAWDRGESDDPTDPVARYNLYYRANGTYPWTLLGTTGSLVEQFEVSTDILDYGVYDFAVTSVTASGAESDPHTSLDDTADPQTGWFADWRP